MAITDELRQYASYAATDRFKQSMLDIADRIDAEHERVIASVMNDALYHANEKDMAELGWVRLPKDADGEYIHIGDELRDAWHEQKQGEVQRLVLDRHGWWLMLKNNCERFYAHGFHEWHNCHHKPPTVEDVLREFALACEDAGNAGPEVERIAAEYAKRIRLAGDAE